MPVPASSPSDRHGDAAARAEPHVLDRIADEIARAQGEARQAGEWIATGSLTPARAVAAGECRSARAGGLPFAGVDVALER